MKQFKQNNFVKFSSLKLQTLFIKIEKLKKN